MGKIFNVLKLYVFHLASRFVKRKLDEVAVRHGLSQEWDELRYDFCSLVDKVKAKEGNDQ